MVGGWGTYKRAIHYSRANSANHRRQVDGPQLDLYVNIYLYVCKTDLVKTNKIHVDSWFMAVQVTYSSKNGLLGAW